jgi:hypothetical protein
MVKKDNKAETTSPVAEIETPRQPTLTEQLDALDSLARDVLAKIARDPIRSASTHPIMRT